MFITIFSSSSFFPNSRLQLDATPLRIDSRNRYWFSGKSNQTADNCSCCKIHDLIIQLSNTTILEILSRMTSAPVKDTVVSGSFQQAFSSVLVVAQCLGIMPVIGIKGNSSFGLKFTWCSFRTIYSMTAFLFAASYDIFAICVSMTKPITFKSVGMLLA